MESSGDELKTLEHVELSDDPNYGVSWYFMPDGQGVPRLALLKSYLPDEARLSWTQEGNVNFHLYTRSGTIIIALYSGSRIMNILLN